MKTRTACAVSALALVACIDDMPTAPSSVERAGLSQASSSALYVSGCATLQVDITRSQGRDSVSVSITDNGCGPLQFTVDTSAVKAGSKNSPVIQLPLAVINPESWLVEQVQLISWPDSLIAPQNLSVTWANPDSVAAPAGPARFWFVSGGTVSGNSQVFPRRWLHVTTHKDVTSFTAHVHIRGVPVAGQLPIKPPDYIPPDLFANMDNSWRVPVDIIVLRFDVGTSLADRASAVNTVGGEVVGGLAYDRPDSEGFYFVRVPSMSVDTLMARIRTLEATPVVEWANVLSRVEPMYRLPSDGPGWTEWGIRPTEVDFTSPPDNNWYLQALNLPLAWGCETGSTQTKIGVIDHGFQHHEDLTLNLRPSPPPLDTLSHGLRMVALIGARGNNNTGTTGVMWEAGIRTYPLLIRSPEEIALRLRTAAENGERVINLSFGRIPTHVDSIDDRLTKDDLAIMMRELRKVPGPLPLIVIGGGNYAADAYHSSFPALKDSLPNNTLVVIPAQRAPFQQGVVNTTLFIDDAYTGPAAEGRLIDVAAPGDRMWTLGKGEELAETGASSAATALVTGVAGLLASFDPSLTAGQLKEIIVESAVSSGRAARGMSGSYPYVDAYGALQLAANRNNSLPLCRTRLASVGDTIFAERAGSWEPMIEEANGGWLNAYHGGRNLTVEALEGISHFVLQGGAWSLQQQAPNLDPGGAFHSRYSRSHDGDSAVAVGVNGVSTFSISVGGEFGGGTPQFPHTITLAPLQEGASYCTRWSTEWGCIGTTLTESFMERVFVVARFMTDVRFGQAQVGVSFEFISDSTGVGEPYSCDGDTCRDAVRTQRTIRTDNYRVDRQTGDWTFVSTVPYRAASQALSEDGEELIRPRSIWTLTATYSWQPGTTQGVSHVRTAEIDCAVDFLAWDDEALLTSTPTIPLCYERIQTSTGTDSIIQQPSINATISP